METFQKYQPEIVFHLAAQPLVRLSYAEPKLTFNTNVGGTVTVFEAIRKTPSVKVLLNVTSDKCYENREWVWGYRENDPMGGHDPLQRIERLCGTSLQRLSEIIFLEIRGKRGTRCGIMSPFSPNARSS
jgi:nucleoside-diphosphate-sugar epimerase